MKKQYCITETSTVIWSEKIQDECRYSRGREVIAVKSKSFVVSEGEFALTITGKVKQCKLEMWASQQDMLIIIDNETTIISPIEHGNDYSHSARSNYQMTNEIAMISYVVYQVEELTYKLFTRTYTSICKLRQQRLQLLKSMMYNGDAMFVARMILNTTSFTAHGAGQLLAVSKCELV